MKKINLIQGSDAWHEFRKVHIGSSEASIINGTNPWRKPGVLWKEKLGLSKVQEINEAMQRGIILEPKARKCFNEIMMFDFEPAVYESEEYPFLSASLDGICFYNYDNVYDNVMAVEIKCNGEKNHELARKKIIPQYYIDQLQHQILVCELDSIFYFSYDGTDGIIIEVKRDQAYIDSLLIKLKEFWRCLQELEEPETGYIIRNDEEWDSAAKEYLYFQKTITEMEEQKELARQRLLALSGESNVMGAGLKLSRIPKKGLVDYTKIPEIRDIDLELYRRPDTTSIRITIA